MAEETERVQIVGNLSYKGQRKGVVEMPVHEAEHYKAIGLVKPEGATVAPTEEPPDQAPEPDVDQPPATDDTGETGNEPQPDEDEVLNDPEDHKELIAFAKAKGVLVDGRPIKGNDSKETVQAALVENEYLDPSRLADDEEPEEG